MPSRSGPRPFGPRTSGPPVAVAEGVGVVTGVVVGVELLLADAEPVEVHAVKVRAAAPTAAAVRRFRSVVRMSASSLRSH
jgi:hypothetical protein